MKLYGFLIGQIEILLVEVLKFVGFVDVMMSWFFCVYLKFGYVECGVIVEVVFVVLCWKMEFLYLVESGIGMFV